MFSAGLVLLLEQCPAPQPWVTVDLEYVGWEGEIKRHVLNRLVPAGHWIRKHQIIFDRIGKASPAHDLAWRTFRGKAAPTLRATLANLMRVL